MNPPGAILLPRRARPRRPARRRFQLEPLERRDLPSAALPGVVATSPGDGSSVIRAPASLTIAFDPSAVAQIDAAFTGFLPGPPDQTLPGLFALDGSQEVEVDRIGPDGSTTPIYGTASTPAVPQALTATTAADGTVRAQLVVTLPTNGAASGPGTYQIDFLPQTTLASAFGLIEPTSSWATSTAPIPVERFTVTGQGPTLADATDLGTIGAAGTTAAGSLDPSYYRAALAFYRFELPRGQDWQLDAQVLAGAIGSPVQAALALFDAGGNLLATRNAGDGTTTDPVDPALFRDLPGGTYYLGISAAGNLPGAPGGYDPIGGKPGTGGLSEPAGAFRLAVAAAPVAAPSALTSFGLEHADPLISAPTALDLSFSGPIDTTLLHPPNGQETALQVVDDSGRVWPISVVPGANSANPLRLMFDGPLPPGSYSLIVPEQGGLTDLDGRPVIGPSGSAPGVLATWIIAPPSAPADPTDLGVLWRGPDGPAWGPKVSGTTVLAPGQAVTDRFVTIYPGLYALQVQPGAGSVDAEIVTSSGEAIPAQGPSPLHFLTPGTYHLRISNTGDGAASVRWTLVPLLHGYGNITLDGVGQAQALTLPMLGTVPGPRASTVGPAAPVPSPTPTPTATPTAGTGPVASEKAATSPSLAAGLLVSLDTSPAGSPADAGRGTATAPTADAASASLADAGRIAMARLFARTSTTGAPPRAGEDEGGAPTPERVAMPAPATAAGPLADDPATASARTDAMALAMAREDPMARIAGWIARSLPGGPAPQIAPADLDEALLAVVEERADGDNPGRAPLARADLSVPIVVLVGTAMTYRLARPIGKWWRRHPAEPRARSRPHRLETTRDPS